MASTAGLVQPSLGIGKVWRENAGVRQAIGWATNAELPGTGRFEMFLGGNMVYSSQTGKTFVFLSESKRVQAFDVAFSEH